MQCALVFYLVVTIFVVVYSLPELCVIQNFGKKLALCGKDVVEYTFDFIPPISQNISRISLFRQPLKQLPYNAFRNLSSQTSMSGIWLQSCQISYVDAGALSNLHNLTHIDLSYNDINQIDSKLFSDTKQIKYINMAYNKIEVVLNGLFQHLPLLEEVYLHHNQILQVENHSFKNTPSLQVIHLHNNQIEFMCMLFKEEFNNLESLTLDGNPWKCNCDLRPLYDFLIKINQLDQYGLICEEPPILHGRNWNDISRDEFVCHSKVVISTEGSIMTNMEPVTTTAQDENIPVTVYNETRYHQVDTGIPQSPLIQNWILYSILGLLLVCVVAVIIGVVFVVRYTLVKSNTSRHVRLPTIIKRRSDRINARHMDSGLQMRVQSSAVSENSDTASNTDDDVNEESTSIRHYEIREATTN